MAKVINNGIFPVTEKGKVLVRTTNPWLRKAKQRNKT